MAEVHQTIEIHAPADEVWALVGDPTRIGEWVPALASSSSESDTRSCTTTDGAEIVERILDRSDEKRHHIYEITSSPLPLKHYRSMIAVHGHDGHSHILWEAQFEGESPEVEPRLVEAFDRIYSEGLAALRDHFAAAVHS